MEMWMIWFCLFAEYFVEQFDKLIISAWLWLKFEVDFLFELFRGYDFDDFALTFESGLNKVESHVESLFHELSLIIG